jgi:hypothetical protein
MVRIRLCRWISLTLTLVDAVPKPELCRATVNDARLALSMSKMRDQTTIHLRDHEPNTLETNCWFGLGLMAESSESELAT